MKLEFSPPRLQSKKIFQQSKVRIKESEGPPDPWISETTDMEFVDLGTNVYTNINNVIT